MEGRLHQVRCFVHVLLWHPILPYLLCPALYCPVLQPWVFESIIKTGGQVPLLENYGFTGVNNL